MIRSLAVERAARAIWRALHHPHDAPNWDDAERGRCLMAAEMAAQILQHDLVVRIPHLGRVS